MAYNSKVPTHTGFLDTPPLGYVTAGRTIFGMPIERGRDDYNEAGGYNPTRFGAAAIESLGQERAFGTQAERDAYKRFQAFDPDEAFQRYYGGVLDQTTNALGDALTDLAGRSVGAGRLKTGFFDRDQGDTVRRYLSDATASGQQAALQTAGMRQQQLGTLLSFGQQARNRYLDLLNGNFDRVTGIENSQGGFGLGDALQIGASVLPFVL